MKAVVCWLCIHDGDVECCLSTEESLSIAYKLLQRSSHAFFATLSLQIIIIMKFVFIFPCFAVMATGLLSAVAQADEPVSRVDSLIPSLSFQ
jgi:hypothetical protein